MATLHLYQNDVVDTVSAYSPEDAEMVCREILGEDDLLEECRAADFEQMEDGTLLVVLLEDLTVGEALVLPAGATTEPKAGALLVTATAAEWARMGRTWLCSTEW